MGIAANVISGIGNYNTKFWNINKYKIEINIMEKFLPKIIYNDDTCSLRVMPKPHSLSQIPKAVEYLKNTQVGCICWSIASGDLAYSYHSTFIENAYDMAEKDGGYSATGNEGNLLLNLHRQGIDYLPTLINELRKINIAFFASFRMNDIHFKSEPEGMLATEFWKQHQEMRLWGVTQHRSYDNAAMDYSYPEVRDNRLNSILEVAERYDVDGIELDFCRNPLTFNPDEAWEKREILTDFIRQIRGGIEKIGNARNRKIKLLIRLPFDENQRRNAGMEVEEWIKDKLMDILVMSNYANIYNIEVEPFLSLCHANDILFYPSVECTPSINSYPSVELPDEVRPPRHNFVVKESAEETVIRLRAMAQNFLAQGVDGVYMFNYPCTIFQNYPISTFPNPMDTGELKLRAALLSQAGSTETLAKKEKEYTFWHELPIYVEASRPAKYFQTIKFYVNDEDVLDKNNAITISFHQVVEDNPHAYCKPLSRYAASGYVTYLLNGEILDESKFVRIKQLPGRIQSGFVLGEHELVQILVKSCSALQKGWNALGFEIRHTPVNNDPYIYIYELNLHIEG